MLVATVMLSWGLAEVGRYRPEIALANAKVSDDLRGCRTQSILYILSDNDYEIFD